MRQSKSRNAVVLLALAAQGVLVASAGAAVIKDNNTLSLNSTGSWVSGVLPAAGDIIAWDSTVTAANAPSLGANVSYAGIQILNPGGPVSIGGSQVLTYGASGIDMSNATQDLTINVGTLRAGPNATTAHPWTIAPGRTLTINSNHTVQGGTHTITVSGGGDLVYNGNWTSTGGGLAVTQSAANVTLNGANNFGNTNGNYILNGGTLTVGNADALTSTRLDLATASLRASVDDLLLNATNVRATGNPTIDGTHSFGFASGSTITNVNANRVVTNNIAAGKTFTLANVNLSNTTDNRTFTITGTGDTVIAGVISNGSSAASNLTKSGTGTLILTNSGNTYTGNTTVNGGTLLVGNGTAGAIPGGVAVNSAATLGGTGTIGGAVSVNAGGSVAPGAIDPSVGLAGTLSTGSLTLAATATTLIDLTGPSSADRLAVTGAVALGGTLNLVLGYAPAVGDMFFVITNDGSDLPGGAFSNAPDGGMIDTTFNGDIYRFAVGYGGDSLAGTFTGGNDVVLSAVAIPEPGVMALVVPVVGLLGRRRARR